jgi:hypothetical protein
VLSCLWLHRVGRKLADGQFYHNLCLMDKIIVRPKLSTFILDCLGQDITMSATVGVWQPRRIPSGE